jgi:hypothetical protein
MNTKAKDYEGEEFKFPDEKEAEVKDKLDVKAEDEFEFDIEDDTPPEDRGRKPAPPPEDPTEEELASYDEKVQARIKKFTRGYHDERRAKEAALREREAAEAYARQILEENKKLQQQLATGSKQFIETSKFAAEAKLAAAKKKYKEAFDSADADAMAEANAEITEATYELRETSRLRPIEVDETKYTPAPETQKPKVSPRTQRWLDANSDWWGKDEEMSLAAMGLDKKLQREYGEDYVGTEEYFRTIDKTMRKRFPEYFDTQSSEDDPPPKKRVEPAEEDEPLRRALKSATVVAPASRSTSPSRVRLKASEASIARRLGVPLEEYAKQVAKLGQDR